MDAAKGWFCKGCNSEIPTETAMSNNPLCPFCLGGYFSKEFEDRIVETNYPRTTIEADQPQGGNEGKP